MTIIPDIARKNLLNLNAFLVESEYFFAGFYLDSDYKIPATGSEIVTSPMNVYFRFLTKDEIHKLVDTENIILGPMSTEDEINFEAWYVADRTFWSLFFGDRDRDKEQAKKYWYKYIRRDNNSSSSNPSPGRGLSEDTVMYQTPTEKGIIVKTAMSPGEVGESNGSADNNENQENNESGVITEESEVLEPKYDIEEKYILINNSINPYRFEINPRELWSWTKVG